MAHDDAAWQPLDRAVVGRHPHPGMGISIDGAPPPLIRPAPTLGQHSADVLHALLGLDAPAIAALDAAHVTGTTPLIDP